ncbi:hypothetical protein PHLGIDRAFT_128518 [Phlebiopsis gigantea 11061_1 CR5-6]|uniref:Uncharacterized protein n=1 Tax=Phlebiopsis gigantea (strain 11061_1 CR5-6) TaxID=745531 RepID=A0A0C3S9B4_PHLG1|nr:hypothetical protein PHLGIDRAFT_128518 [Phlebiopsis gigantea 11061_1 CR5-6]
MEAKCFFDVFDGIHRLDLSEQLYIRKNLGGVTDIPEIRCAPRSSTMVRSRPHFIAKFGVSKTQTALLQEGSSEQRVRVHGSPSRAPPTPIRKQSLGRVLYNNWQDKTSIIYQAVSRTLIDEVADIDNRFLNRGMDNCSGLLERNRACFDKALRDLREQGIAYDPRDPHAQIPYGDAGKLARETRKLWEKLKKLEKDCAWFGGEMEYIASKIQEGPQNTLEKLKLAKYSHHTFMVQLLRYTLRWRIVGKTVLFGACKLSALRHPHRFSSRGFETNTASTSAKSDASGESRPRSVQDLAR